MNYREEIHKLIDSIDQEGVLRFLYSFIRHLIENKGAMDMLLGLGHESLPSK